MITFILCALLFFVSTCSVSICSITVFALISSQYRFCPFFCEEFSHHSFPKWFPRLAGSWGANQRRHFYKFVFPSHKKTSRQTTNWQESNTMRIQAKTNISAEVRFLSVTREENFIFASLHIFLLACCNHPLLSLANVKCSKCQSEY